MKKILLFTAALAALLSAASCQKEEMGAVEAGNGNVTFTIQTPEDAVTKAIGEVIGKGENVNIVHYEIYKADNHEIVGDCLVDSYVRKDGDGKFLLSLNLLEDQDYIALFWAEVEGNGYYNTEDLRDVQVVYNDADNSDAFISGPQILSNAEDRAAFYKKFEFSTASKQSHEVKLVRPFAQINIGTVTNSLDYEVTIQQSTVTVANPALSFNVFDGCANADNVSEYPVVFGLADAPSYPASTEEVKNLNMYLNVNETNYNYVAMNYILVNGERSTVNLDFSIATDKGTVTRSLVDVPVAQNYRTNIIGDLISKETKIEVVVDNRFNQPQSDLNVEVLEEIPAKIDLGNGNSVILPELSANHTVVVKGMGTIELQGTTIASAEGPAISLEPGAEVTLVITDNLKLTGASQGIYVTPETDETEAATLLIKGSGNLVVEGLAGSGIDGSVTIDGLTNITAKGNGDHAYGIGGIGANVVIKNTTVDYACGGHIQPLFVNDLKYGKSEPEGGAAIGGAYVKIEGSTVTKADGGSKAAAIGESYWQSTEIEIINSTIVEANGGNASAGIGGSRYASEGKYNLSVKIQQNSNVTATGGQFGAGIGSGYDTHCNGQDYEAVNYIEIDASSVINAKGGKYAAGIGTGFHSAYLSGSIAAGAKVTAESGETFYKDAYYTAQNIGYGVVDPAREFSGANAKVTFTVAGEVIDSPNYPYVETENGLEIYAAQGLIYFAEQVNQYSNYERPYEGKTVKLMNDIDLKGMEWTPIGDYRFSANRFSGTFDGQGHTVSNFQITKKTDKNDSNKSSYGFFGNVEGTVKNLTIANAKVSSYAYTGALAGRLNSGLIENCHVVNCAVSNTYWQGGILVGQVNGEGNHPVISNCSVKNSSITSKSAVGAISGPVTTTKEGNATFENCIVEDCQVIQEGSFGGSYDNLFGTMFGYLEADVTSKIDVNNCTVTNTTVKGELNAPISGDFDGQIYINGSPVVTTEAKLESALKVGGNVTLVNNITLTKSLAISNADFVLDGNGYTISQAEECTNSIALFDITGGKAAFKNVTFDGVKEGAVVRTVGVEFMADNVTAKNGEHTQQQGLFRLLGKSTVINCTFENNTCSMVITLNYDGANNDPQVVENCVFEGNTCNATAVIYYVKGESATVNGNKFIGNSVEATSNAATLYMGFTENNVITNNLFKNNAVTTTGTTKRATGGVMLGYETEITGNAFIGNTVTGTNAKGNDVCASVYYTDIDLSGNYWGGSAPVENDDYFVEYPDNNKVIINDYLTANPFN